MGSDGVKDNAKVPVKRIDIGKNINGGNMQMALRITAGIILSVLAARALGLEFAASTCIVTLLGIQVTKRETLRTAAKRVISIAFTMGIAVAAYMFLGNTMQSFCVAVACLTFLTYILGWNGTLSINVVVLVHLFIQQEPFTSGLILNEVIRVMVGIVIALAVNCKLPTGEKKFWDDMKDIENSMSHILGTFADILRGEARSIAEIGGHLNELKEHLIRGRGNAYTFADNNLSEHARYYVSYIDMRRTEALILYKIYLNIGKFDAFNESSGKMADYLDAVGHGIAFEHPMDEIMEKADIFEKAFNESEIPAEKSGLKDMALLYFIKESLGEIVDAKEEFVDSLSAEERQRYWATDHR